MRPGSKIKKAASNYETAFFFDLRFQKAFNIPDESFGGFDQREDRILVEVKKAESGIYIILLLIILHNGIPSLLTLA